MRFTTMTALGAGSSQQRQQRMVEGTQAHLLVDSVSSADVGSSSSSTYLGHAAMGTHREVACLMCDRRAVWQAQATAAAVWLKDNRTQPALQSICRAGGSSAPAA